MPEQVQGDDAGRRLAELEQVNAELAAELRRLLSDRAAAPRQGAVQVGRRIGQLRDELVEARTQAAELRLRNEELERHNCELGEAAHIHAENAKASEAEVQRLNSGPVGYLRRLWDRFARR